MENAPKALLIAGAILIVILLISVALLIVNSISGVTEQSSTTTESISIQMFNSQFLPYFTDSASGSEAKAFAKKIMQHNSSVNSSTLSLDSHHVVLNFYPKGKSKVTHVWTNHAIKSKIYDKISDDAIYKIHVTNCKTAGSLGGYHDGYLACLSITEL